MVSTACSLITRSKRLCPDRKAGSGKETQDVWCSVPGEGPGMSARGIREPRGQDMDLVSWEPGLWDLHRPFLCVLSSNSGLLEFHVGPAVAPRSAGLLQDRGLRHILPEGRIISSLLLPSKAGMEAHICNPSNGRLISLIYQEFRDIPGYIIGRQPRLHGKTPVSRSK